MSDRKDKKFDLEGIDWDDALKEWEDKTFLPEVARDRETHTPGSLQGTPLPPAVSASSSSASPPSKPLYVPPRRAEAREHRGAPAAAA